MSDIKKRMAEDALQSAQARQFNSDIGSKAVISREQFTGDAAIKANRMLRDIGDDLNPFPPRPGMDFDGVKYMGSCAAHVYQSEQTQEIFFVNQTQTMQDLPEVTASKCFENLRGDMQEMYGTKRQARRSGF